jgi:hypothetical protein
MKCTEVLPLLNTKGASQVEEENLNFFTEIDTRLIYEASFYDDFVLVRPASPAFATALRQLSWTEFTTEFEEFWGDRVRLRMQIDGIDPDEDDKVQNVQI